MINEKSNSNEPEDVKQIAEDCLDSPGYLMFAAQLSSERDKDGRAVINFKYRRYHLSLEDARQACKALKEFVEKEVQDLIRSYENGADEQA